MKLDAWDIFALMCVFFWLAGWGPITYVSPWVAFAPLMIKPVFAVLVMTTAAVAAAVRRFKR
ncbi:hypothetical protein G5B41_17700 [bacterium SGD-2]|nr:hypothetical protein [bacterium SGD-2]